MDDRSPKTSDELDWRVRNAIYGRFAECGTAPVPRDLALTLGVEEPWTEASLHRLHDRHALFLDPHASE